MKYFKRLKLYKANNVTFDPETMIADSYDWWHFVERINGQIVFNAYFYSPSTSKHQSKVRSLLNELNIKIDVVVKTRAGLQAAYGVNSSKELAEEALTEALMNQDIERAEKIAEVFKVKLTQKRIKAAYEKREEQLCKEYLKRAFDYAEKKRSQNQLELVR